MKIDKKILFVLSLFILSCSQRDSEIDGKVETIEKHAKGDVLVNAVLGGWSEKGNCVRGSGNCGFAINRSSTQKNANSFPINLSLLSDNEILINYTSSKPSDDEGNTLNFQNNISIPTDICSNLGKSSITILAGRYEFIYSVDKNKSVIVKAVIK